MGALNGGGVNRVVRDRFRQRGPSRSPAVCRLIVTIQAHLGVDRQGDLKMGGDASMAEPPTGADAGMGDNLVAPANDRAEDDRVREGAYLIWVDEGRPHGRELDHWLQAKWEIEGEPKP
jgi:hypothetical protein